MPGLTRMRILVVEDDATSRLFLVEALAQAGHEVLPCVDFRSAVAASVRRVDLVLTDLALPDGDGEALFRHLRSGDESPNRATPVVVLSAEVSARSRARLLRTGFAAVLEKPVAIEALERLLLGLRAGVADPGSDWNSAPPGKDRTGNAANSPVLDDAAALLATGTPEIVAGLRRLFRDELPAQLDQIEAALATGDSATAHAVLHRLVAACGFCGALGLRQAAHALDQALATPGKIPVAVVDAFRESGVRCLERLRAVP